HLRPPPPSTLFPYTTLFRSGFRLDMNELRALAAVRMLLGYAMRDLTDLGVGGAFDPNRFVALESIAVDLLSEGEAKERQRQPHRSEEHTSELQSRENLVCRL